jgi:hypothetical protein
MSLTPRIDRLDKNYLINGSFDYWQRSTSTLVSNGSVEYVADRWISGPGIDGAAGSQTTFSRDTDTPDNKVKYSAKADGTYVPGEELSWKQRIESIFARDLSDETISLGFWIKSEDALQARVKLSTADVEDDFSVVTDIHTSVQTITNDSVWQEIKLEGISLPDVSNGLQLTVTLIMDGTGTFNHWFAKPILSIGSQSTGFTYAGTDLLSELALCRRYFEKSYDLDEAPGTTTFNGVTTTWVDDTGGYHARYTMHSQFLVTKRTIPVAYPYNPSNGAINQVYASANISMSAVYTGVSGFSMQRNIQPGSIYVRAYHHWTADAEL